jgi:hypothetical protein
LVLVQNNNWLRRIFQGADDGIEFFEEQ